MRIREANSDDWLDIAALLAELGRPDVRATTQEAGARRLFEAYLEQKDTEALVAEIDGDVVGFANLEYRQRLNYQSRQGWIAELIVSEERRGAGVGKGLLQALEAKARNANCWGLALESAVWRKDAHRFYEREGWRQISLAFTKLIDPKVSEPGEEARK